MDSTHVAIGAGAAGMVLLLLAMAKRGGKNTSQNERPSCCPPDSIASRNAFQAGATEPCTGTELTLPNSNMHVYFAQPPPGVEPKALVLMFHDIFGLSSGRTRHLVDEIASWGYFCICPDYFDDADGKQFSAESSLLPTWQEPWRLLFGVSTFAMRGRMPWDSVQAKLHDEVLPFLAGMKPELVSLPRAAVGFCWGGWAITRLAATGELKCAVGFHPSPDIQVLQRKGLSTNEMYKSVKCPLLYLPAWNDPSWLKEKGSVLSLLPPGSEARTFSDMSHGWVNRGDVRQQKVAEQVALALQLARTYIEKHI